MHMPRCVQWAGVPDKNKIFPIIPKNKKDRIYSIGAELFPKRRAFLSGFAAHLPFPHLFPADPLCSSHCRSNHASSPDSHNPHQAQRESICFIGVHYSLPHIKHTNNIPGNLPCIWAQSKCAIPSQGLSSFPRMLIFRSHFCLAKSNSLGLWLRV